MEIFKHDQSLSRDRTVLHCLVQHHPADKNSGVNFPMLFSCMKSGSKHIQLKWKSVQNVKIILVTHWYHHELPPWSSSIMLISRCSTHKMLIWFHQHCLLLEVAPCCQYTITVLSPQLVQSLSYCIREHCLVSDSVVGIE